MPENLLGAALRAGLTVSQNDRLSRSLSLADCPAGSGLHTFLPLFQLAGRLAVWLADCWLTGGASQPVNLRITVRTV